MKPILLIGSSGQLGADLVTALAPLGAVVACDRHALDLAQPEAIISKVREIAPSIIVNAAAYTAVDRAESESVLAHAVNATAPAVLATEAKRTGALLVHYSTDYVFEGEKTAAYVESDAPNPRNVYGSSKLAGERAILESGAEHLIFRTSWVYSAHGANFLRTMLRLATVRSELKVINDQFGAPTAAIDLAQATVAALLKRRETNGINGLFHLSAGGSTTWFDYADTLFKLALPAEARPRLIPISTAEYAAPAARPRNSILSNAKFNSSFGIALPHWQDSVRECLKVLAAGAD